MRDFAAIDVETANHEFTSICSVGLVVVRDGAITERFYSLVRPEPDYYSYYNTLVHGLTDADTCHAPLFCDVWARVEALVGDLPLVAHNASFDQRCIFCALRMYRLDFCHESFLCTLRAARKYFGKQLPNFQLQTVARACGYELINHHNAVADAEACAHIALRVL
ncbi:exonuclease [Porphyromonas macacae]|uniref:Exonuclease n=1 Tax=Porphyromonas macacae TaxID=28115 RepID=A0A0A2E6K4_9PORP|nr:3'-5' exonuclease [Porphyromonas macacae]KGN74491.1 exonuclease [Porphyromonas macacae]